MYIAIQNFEGYLLVPIVQKHAVSLPPALTIMGQVFLGVLIGLPGLIVATPLTAAAMVLVRMIYIEDVLHESPESSNNHAIKTTSAVAHEIEAQ